MAVQRLGNYWYTSARATRNSLCLVQIHIHVYCTIICVNFVVEIIRFMQNYLHKNFLLTNIYGEYYIMAHDWYKRKYCYMDFSNTQKKGTNWMRITLWTLMDINLVWAHTNTITLCKFAPYQTFQYTVYSNE